MGSVLNITVGNNNKKGKNKKRVVNKKSKMRFQNVAPFDDKFSSTSFGSEKLANRACRFKEHLLKNAAAAAASTNDNGSAPSFDIVDRTGGGVLDEFDTWTDVKIVGSCQELEKKYLRLTKVRWSVFHVCV